MRRRVFVLIALCALMGARGSVDGAEPVQGFLRVLIVPDTSGSLDPREYRMVVSLIAEQLPKLSTGVGAQEVGLLPWAGPGDALRSAEWVRLAPPPVVETVALPFSEGETLFRGARQQRERREQKAGEVRQTDAAARYLVELSTALQPLVTHLRGLCQGKADCSDVRGVLERCRQERAGTLALVITDAEETCDPHQFEVGRSNGAVTVLILVPAKVPAPGLHCSEVERLAWLRKVAPGVIAVPSFRITSDPTDWLPADLTAAKTPVQAPSGGTGR